MYTDPHGQEWTKDEIQFLVCQVGSLNKASRRLGMSSVRRLREMEIKTAPEYVRDRATADPMWLKDLIIRYDGRKAAARHLNVSISHLQAVLDSIECQNRHRIPDLEAARAAMKKFGSVIFAARMLETSEAMLKKALGEEWRQLKDATKAGNTSVKTGRVAELYYIQQRGEKITSDLSTDNHNHPGYDVEDAEYGRVNVKAAVLRSKRWIWEFEADIDADALALVLMDENRKPVGYVIIEKLVVTEHNTMSPKWSVTQKSPEVNKDVTVVLTGGKVRVKI